MKISSIYFEESVLTALDGYLLSISGRTSGRFISRSAVVNNILRRELKRQGYDPATYKKGRK